MRYDKYIGRAQSFPEIYKKYEQQMRDAVMCKKLTHKGAVCGNVVTINAKNDPAAVSGGVSYVIKCSKCDNEVRTVSSISLPIDRCGYAERVPY